MGKKLILCLPFFFQVLFAQTVLKGKVVSEETRSPVPSVSVFLNNTSIGTVTNEQGQFILKNIPAGKFRLIASSVGYQTSMQEINPKTVSKEILIVLKAKPDELQGFSVSPTETSGWEKWGKTFRDLFIGTTPKANDCHLENPQVMRFRMNADNTLTAFAREPLIITNDALGYEIHYKLEEFEYDFNSKLCSFSGYALFKDLSLTHPKRAQKYAEERLETYRGSLLHFMRAFYANQLLSQGFEMHSLGNISNPEKDRAKIIFAMHKDSVILDTVGTQVHNSVNSSGNPYVDAATVLTIDSTDYFKKMLKQPDSVISHQPIAGDSLGFAVDSSIAGLYFADSLEVSYKLKDIPPKYKSLSKENKKQTYPISQFVFVNRNPVYVLNSGYYYKPYDLKITGFWAWWENMSTKLPYDYLPPLH